MAYQIALPALIANLPILSEFRFVPGSGRGLWKQSRGEIANQVSGFYRLVQSSLVDVGIQRDVIRIA